MKLLSKLFRWNWSRKRKSCNPCDDALPSAALRQCRFESMEERQVLSADPLTVGAVYIEQDDGGDGAGDTFEVTFEGGAEGTQLNRVVISGDKFEQGLGRGDVFFDTIEQGLGADHAIPFTIVSMDGIDSVSAGVVDGSTELELTFTGFDAGDKLVFSIDVDEVIDFDPNETDFNILNEDIDPITSGVEFQGSSFTTEFSAEHFHDIAGEGEFRNVYDSLLAGKNLDLTADNAGGQRDRSAGTGVELIQTPLPVTISGDVWHDANLDLLQQPSEEKLDGVTLELWQKGNGGDYAFTGHTTQTVNGHYEFGEDLNLLPGTYQVRQQQPADYFSMGSVPGTVEGAGVGQQLGDNRNILTEITIVDGGTSAVDFDFAEAQPAKISGYVYHDRDNDGARETGEDGIGQVEVHIEAINSIAPQAPIVVLTDADGYYEASGLAPGLYRLIEFVQPAGYIDGKDTLGKVDGAASGTVASGGDRFNNIKLDGGSEGVDYNFGEILPAEIHGRVHHSTPDGDCFTEGVEHNPVEGAQILLKDENGQTIGQTLTNAQGEYSFTGLLPGRYTVVEITPAHLIDGDEHVGTIDGVTEGVITGNDTISQIDLLGGQTAVHYDFCEHLPASISGHVYHDANNNGVREAGEELIVGAQVDLIDGEGNVVSATTNAQGYFDFTGLAAGGYRLVEHQPSGYLDGVDAAGTIGGATVGAAVNPGDEIKDITLRWGDEGANYDFGELRPASVSGYVYHDANNNGQRDSGEDPISGVRVQIVPVDTALPQSAVTVTTDANGFYEATGLSPGEYDIVETDQPNGYFDGLDAAGTVGGQTRGAAVNPGDRINGVTLNSGEAGVQYNFGELLPNEIQGRVHLSTPDGDCFTEGVEHRPLSGVTIQLFNADGDLIRETTTNANGEYEFTELPLGVYTVVEVTPTGLIDGDEHVGEVDGAANGQIAGNDTISNIILGSGQTGRNYDFCEHEPSLVSGYVYHDRNNDSDRDAGEEAISGAAIRLLDESGVQVGTTTTNAAGFYEFLGLPAGRYTIVEQQPSGYLDGLDAAGTIGGVTVGQAVNPGDRLQDIAIRWGEEGVEYNFGELKTANISGHVYHDRNNDGVRDAGEEGIAGAVVRLTPIDTVHSQGEVTATTDEDGFYQFQGISPGEYRIVEEQPNGYLDGMDAAGKVGGVTRGAAANPGDEINGIALGSDESGVDYDFGELVPAEIRGRVHLSTPEGDCFTEGLEHRPIEGATIRLFDEGGNLLAETTTDAQGQYVFDELPPGAYTVMEVTPEGLIDGDEHVGDVDGVTTGVISANDTISGILVGSGDVAAGYHFCEHEPASLSGHAYHDRDNDGVRDAGEEAIGNVEIILQNESGAEVARTTTNSQGYYEFLGLPSGRYAVLEQQPAGYLDGLDTAGTVDGTASGSALNPGDAIRNVDLLWGSTGVDYDFGEIRAASVSGHVYHDQNNDGVRDAGEEPIAGVQIQLVPRDTFRPQGALTTTTDENGFYEFTGISPGTHDIIQVEQPQEYLDGLDAAGTVGGQARGAAVNPGDRIEGVTLGAGESGIDYDFGELLAGEIRGRVQLSTPDGDCFTEEGEEHRPIEGAVVRLFNEQGDLVAETLTDENGQYIFGELPPGAYTVVEVTPDGLIDGDEHVGEVDGNASGVISANDTISGIELGSGQSAVGYHFCEHLPSSLSGHVYHDANNNGARDAGEQAIAGVQVVLKDTSGATIATASTNEHGLYHFTNLRAGAYVVTEVHPAGWLDGTDAAGTIDGQVVGQAINPGDQINNVTLRWGEHGVDYDFGELREASISGYVYHDRDNDRVRDQGESPIPGVEIRVTPIDTVLPQSSVTVFTDENGYYEVAGLSPGLYRVIEIEQPVGYLDGLDSAGTVSGQAVGAALNPGDQLNNVQFNSGDRGVEYNFGELLPAEIRGRVHLSTHDGDCFSEDVEHPPLAGVDLILLDAGGNEVARTQTDQLGRYSFTGLRPGDYTIIEETPEGLIDGGARAGRVGNQQVGEAIDGGTISRIVVSAGQRSVENDFCEHPPASLSGHVYHDANNNGLRDGDETAIAGTDVTLQDADGAVVGNARTNADGYYEFIGLHSGTYMVTETQPLGWLDGADAAGSVGGLTVGEAINPGDKIQLVSLKWGDEGVNYNFGELLPVGVSGHVYHDANNNGVRDQGEAPISGVEIRIEPVATVHDQQAIVVTTDENGYYEARGLSPGEYRIIETVQPAGYLDGLDAAGSVNGQTRGAAVNPGDRIDRVTLSSGEQGVDYDFGELLPVEIRGHVHLTDENGDCFGEGVEYRPLAGAQLELRDEQGNVVAQTTTDSNGQYVFTGLPPGVYSVFETTPDGYFNGGAHVGQVDGVTIGAAQTDAIVGIQLISGQSGDHYDFCEHEPAELSGYVYHDENNNGIRDAGEAPISGVTVTLLDSQGRAVRTEVTGADGQYRFDDLRAGNYAIVEQQPEGWADSLDVAGTIDGVVVGEAINPGDQIQNIALGWGQQGVDYDFGEGRFGSIAGRVHADADNDCEVDEGEALLEGVTIRLLDAEGNEVASTQTNAQGEYRFGGLLPGRYTVVQDQPQDYFDGDQVAGEGGGDVSVANTISGIELRLNDSLVGHNFCERPPATISGFVFQDGNVIFTEDGEPPEDITQHRDGQLTSDDTPLAGVVLELRNIVNGEPIDSSLALPGVYPQGPIRAVTDENGYYEFAGLRAGAFAVFQVHPEGYLDSIDTPGTTSGMADNPGDVQAQAALQPFLARFSVDTFNDAIVAIPVQAGGISQLNNFSEVVVAKTPPPLPPPTPPTPPAAPSPLAAPPVAAPAAPPVLLAPIAQAPVWVEGGGAVTPQSWHLSVINGGTPRSFGDNTLPQPVWHEISHWSEGPWSNDQTEAGLWMLSQRGDDGRLAIGQQIAFGVHHAIPIAGDFNGDGVSEAGLYYQGEWLIDVNGNGVWDEFDLWARLGTAQDRPVVGDWDGDGKDDIGIFGPQWPRDPVAIRHEPGLPDVDNLVRGHEKNLPPKRHEATDGWRDLQKTAEGLTRRDVIDHVMRYGEHEDAPVSGDFNGDGIVTIGVFRDGVWQLDTDGDGRLTTRDATIKFGRPGDAPVAGDFNGDGVDEIGVYRQGEWLLDIDGDQELQAHEKVFEMGGADDQPVVGDWDGDGVDEPGVYRSAG